MKAINSTTYEPSNPLGDVKPKIVIGGNGSKFVPNINASFDFGTGTEEYYINFNRKDKTVKDETASLSDGKVSQKIGKEADEYYIKDGRLKWDIVFDECPESMDIEWEIKHTNGIDFFYQAELTDEEKTHATRPDDIIGSFAVYCNRSNNKYKTGKLCHIMRPFVIDSLGNRAWCTQVINDNKLTITLPKAFMDSATYPVRLDPTFGYDSVGGSTDYWSVAKAAKATSTPAGNGDVTSISCYCSTSGTSNLLVALYSDSTGPATRLAYNDTGSAVGGSAAWVTSSLSCSVTSGTQYWIGFQRTDSGSNIVFAYDSVSNELAMSTSGYLNNPFSVSGYQNQRVSIYATYTESGGTVANGHYYMMNQ